MRHRPGQEGSPTLFYEMTVIGADAQRVSAAPKASEANAKHASEIRKNTRSVFSKFEESWIHWDLTQVYKLSLVFVTKNMFLRGLRDTDSEPR